ncbi:MAG: Trk system potassium transporter TrkA [Gammaproteobacteria bacterium]
MKIIILGAGQVGYSLAEHLATESNDITLVDINRQLLQTLQEQSDIRTIIGKAAYPDTLRQAGVEEADMVIAVTNSDESNMLACQVAHSLFNVPTKIARVRAAQFSELQSIFRDEAIPVDILISPEVMVTNFITELVKFPGSLQVLEFAGGRVLLVAVRAIQGGALLAKPLGILLQSLLPNIDVRIVAIFRRKQAIEVSSQTIIEPDDEVFFLAAQSKVHQVISLMRPVIEPYKRIIIAGGGNIGLHVARALENKHLTKVIEVDPYRCKIIAETLENAMVIKGDASDKPLLLNENIANTDIFFALTNNDYTNIMAALMAKKLGARKVMALITKPAYIELIEGGEIDIAVSPKQLTVDSVLSYVRQSGVARVHTLRHGAAEAIEMVVQGSADNSKISGRRIEQLKLPQGVTIGAIVRGEDIIMPHHETVIQSGDHVILFLLDRKYLGKIERLFQAKERS